MVIDGHFEHVFVTIIVTVDMHVLTDDVDIGYPADSFIYLVFELGRVIDVAVRMSALQEEGCDSSVLQALAVPAIGIFM